MVGTVQNVFGDELKLLLDVKVIWLQECTLYIYGVLLICISVQCISEYWYAEMARKYLQKWKENARNKVNILTTFSLYRHCYSMFIISYLNCTTG